MYSQIRSLGYRTDLAILAFNGRVEKIDSYFFVETPGNPSYFWGNLLLMPDPPVAGSLDLWMKRFRDNFSHQPLVKHITFGWDSPEGYPGDIEPFKAAGFEVEESVILTATQSMLKISGEKLLGLEIRALFSNGDWEAAFKNQLSCRGDNFNPEAYIPFKRAQMERYRKMSEAGLGHWYGAFIHNQLVADCGLFLFEGIARYQQVGTNPDYRRRGICAALVYQTAMEAFKQGAKTLVMAADPEYHAARVYKSVGFAEAEKQIGVCWWPKDEW